ncbi:MAG: hypothetical protein RIR26_1245 [Pseudomonadota bacterium]
MLFRDFRMWSFAFAAFSFSAFTARALADSTTHEIVGGRIVQDLASFEYKHTVRLLVKAVLDGQQVPEPLKGLKMTWRCSGALVSSKVVVTAAHCFPKTVGLTDPVTGALIRGELTELGAEAFFKTDTKADRPWGVRTEKIVVHEGFRDDWTSRGGDIWNPEAPVHDVALVRLAEEAPSEKAPVLLFEQTAPALAEGETVVLAGYGRDISDDQVAIPRLRAVDVPYRLPLRNGSEWYVGHGDFNNAGKVQRPAGGCMGDSGGPVYVRRGSVVRLAGVIVRGPDQENGGCEAAVTIVTALPKYTRWISEKLFELGRH